jgi:hypothetical protein
MASCLETCPPEVLNLVTSVLPGSDIMALFLCGAPRLNIRLFNEGVSVLRFDWSHPRYRIWYPFVMKFRKLDRLDITATYNRFFNRFKPSPTFTTLTELSLTLAPPIDEKTARCLDTPVNEGDVPLNMGECFPILEKLVLKGFTLSTEFVEKLPPTLLHLEITMRSLGDPRMPYLKTSQIKALPRSLTFLNLQPSMESSAANVEALPQGLKTAILNTRLKDETIELFPKSLTLLEANTESLSVPAIISIPSFVRRISVLVSNPADATTWSQEVLPDHVTEIRISGFFNALMFPQKLTLLELDSSGNLLNEDFKNLPPTLKKLHLHKVSPSLSPEVVKTLPKLRSLTMTRVENFSDEWIKAGLPQSLIALDLVPHYSWSNESLALLPRGLRSVNLSKLKKLNDVGVALLPPHLTTLNASGSRYITGECFKDLPRGLAHLIIDTGHSVSDEHIAFLPRGLTYLRIWGAKFLSDNCFRHLPRRLSTLVLDGPSARFTTSKVDSLPKSIKILTFAAEINRDMTTAYFTLPMVKLDSDEREDEEAYPTNPVPKKAATDLKPSSSIFSLEFWTSILK